MVEVHETTAFAPYALRRLREQYKSASADQRKRGRAWYPAARAICRRLSRAYGVSLGKIAAVMAITSPDAQLSTNVEWTEQVLAGTRKGGRYPTDQAPKIARALKSRRPGDHVIGPKVSAFYRAIMGHPAIVLDRWAAHAAGHTREKAPGVVAHREISTAYHALAAETGEEITSLQAIVWLVVRERDARAQLEDII